MSGIGQKGQAVGHQPADKFQDRYRSRDAQGDKKAALACGSGPMVIMAVRMPVGMEMRVAVCVTMRVPAMLMFAVMIMITHSVHPRVRKMRGRRPV